MSRARSFAALATVSLAFAVLAGCSSTTHDPSTMTGGTTAGTTGTTAHDMTGMKPGDSMPTTTHNMGSMKPGVTMAPGK